MFAVLIVVAAVLVSNLARNEPVYQEMQLTHWLEQYATNHFSRSSDSNLESQAETAIRQIGTIPILIKMLTTRPSPVKLELMAVIPERWRDAFRVRSVAQYQRDVFYYRLRAARGFAALRNDARPAVPALTALLNEQDIDTRYCAIHA
ncbi:MAG: hypothetical protein ACYDH9_25240, partial [Limisphaerales bacterium]